MVNAQHRTAARTLHVSASPGVVFPLLCPVREREWVDGWDAVVLHSRSGLAELGCVFVTGSGGDESVFVVTRYEPPGAIGFAVFHGSMVELLLIEVSAANGGSDLAWTRAYTGLTPEGNAWIEANVPAVAEARLAALERMLQAHLDLS